MTWCVVAAVSFAPAAAQQSGGQRSGGQRPGAPEHTHDQAHANDAPPLGGSSTVLGGVASAPQSPSQGLFRDVYVSLDLLTALGASTARDATLLELQGGEHDPRKRGFTLQQAELQLSGDIDDWLSARGVLVSFLEPDTGESVFEVEEAFLQTRQLPENLQLRVGHYFTEFGRVNPLHPHAWDFQDQPVILSRLFGPEGMRAPGARLAWLAPTHQYLEFFVGLQNGNGETMSSFLASDELYEERAVGGRLFDGDRAEARSSSDLVWTGRVVTTFALGEGQLLGVGASGAFGQNATGGDTRIAGVDFAWQWRAADAGPQSAFVRLQGEYLWRDFDAAAQLDDRDPMNPYVLPAATLRDRGGYLYALVGWDNGFSAGARIEHATGSGASYLGGGAFARSADAFRCDRVRVSPLVQYRVSQSSRVRLQYGYDDSDHLASTEHSVWLGFEVLLGSQPVARVGRDGLSGCGCN